MKYIRSPCIRSPRTAKASRSCDVGRAAPNSRLTVSRRIRMGCRRLNLLRASSTRRRAAPGMSSHAQAGCPRPSTRGTWVLVRVGRARARKRATTRRDWPASQTSAFRHLGTSIATISFLPGTRGKRGRLEISSPRSQTARISQADTVPKVAAISRTASSAATRAARLMARAARATCSSAARAAQKRAGAHWRNRSPPRPSSPR